LVKIDQSTIKTSLGLEQDNFVILFIRLCFFAAFFIIFQSSVLIQKPFVHVEFLNAFYITMTAMFLMYGLTIVLKKHNEFLHYLAEISVMYYLFNSQPQYASYYFVYIVLILFFAGLQLETKKVFILCFFSSLLLSVVNLKTVRWTGAQNLLTLCLFNFTYVAVGFISTQFKSEISFLKKSLSDSNVKLQSKLDLSKLLIERIPLGIYATDSQNKILFTNQALNDTMKLDHQTANEIVSSASLGGLNKKLIYNSQLSEKRFYETDKASYFDQELNDQVHINLIKDVTESVNIQEQLKQKEKLAAVGQLAAGIAHEIRNPLAGISGSIELLSQDKTDPDEQKLMKIILREIDRLNNLITEFLDYSKPEKAPDQATDLAFILDDVIQNVKANPLVIKNLNFELSISKSIVAGYSDKLKQGFLNIVMNAVQAMKDQPQPTISVSTELTTNEVTVKIKDNGSGMSDTVKNRIFEPFFTTKSKGTGLGMAITHKIFDSHGARIEIDSQIGIGTEFKIIFNKI
jgi:two-component system, NtrC family, sensor histidine kinase PilS